jgi:hypothetical protein
MFSSFEAVRLHGELTRAELARLTALTPQTVSNIVAELVPIDQALAGLRLTGTAGCPRPLARRGWWLVRRSICSPTAARQRPGTASGAGEPQSRQRLVDWHPS